MSLASLFFYGSFVIHVLVWIGSFPVLFYPGTKSGVHDAYVCITIETYEQATLGEFFFFFSLRLSSHDWCFEILLASHILLRYYDWSLIIIIHAWQVRFIS